MEHYLCGRGQFWHYGDTFLTQDALFVVTGSISLSSCLCLSGTSSPTNQNTHRMSQSWPWSVWVFELEFKNPCYSNIIFYYFILFLFFVISRERLYKHCCLCVCQSVSPNLTSATTHVFFKRMCFRPDSSFSYFLKVTMKQSKS